MKNKAAQDLAKLSHQSPKWKAAMKEVARKQGIASADKSDHFRALASLAHKSPKWRKAMKEAIKKNPDGFGATWKKNFQKRWRRGTNTTRQ